MAHLIEIAAEEWRVRIPLDMTYEVVMEFLRSFDGNDKKLEEIKETFSTPFFHWFVDVMGLARRLHMEELLLERLPE